MINFHCACRFLGGDITAPTPPRALKDERIPDPTDFSRFYYAAPELERHDGVGTAPFFSKLNYERDYEAVPMEAVSLAAVTAAIEERKVRTAVVQIFLFISVHGVLEFQLGY